MTAPDDGPRHPVRHHRADDISLGDLADRTFLVAGGSSGLGGAATVALLAAGATVVVPSRRPPADWSVQLPDGPGRCQWIDVDLERPEAEEQLERCSSHLGDEVAVLLSANTYGAGARHTLGSTSAEEFRSILSVNLFAPFLLLRLVARGTLRANRVVAFGSDAGSGAAPGRALYGASKAAIRSLLETFVAETDGATAGFVRVRGRVDTPGTRRRGLTASTEDLAAEYGRLAAFALVDAPAEPFLEYCLDLGTSSTLPVGGRC